MANAGLVLRDEATPCRRAICIAGMVSTISSRTVMVRGRYMATCIEDNSLFLITARNREKKPRPKKPGLFHAQTELT